MGQYYCPNHFFFFFFLCFKDYVLKCLIERHGALNQVSQAGCRASVSLLNETVMKNFIKVIDAYDIEKVINIDFIQSLYKDEDYTIIRFSKDDCIYVKDSYEELSRKLLKLPSETKPSTRKTGRG